MVILRLEDGLVIAANEECARLVGRTRRSILGRTVAELGAWGRPEDNDALKQLMSTRGGVRDLRLHLRRGDGELRPVRCGAETMELGGETVVVATFIDDAEPERRLEESESQFRAAFMTGADACLIVVRDDGRLLEVNDRFVEMFGYDREECRGRTSVEMGMWAHPEQRPEMLAEIERDGQVRNFEGLAVRKNGEVFPCLYSGTPLEIAGQPPLVLVVLRDVTAAQRAREELERSARALGESNALFRAAFMTGSDALAIGSRTDGTMLEVNDLFLEMFGYTREECVGRTALELGMFAEPAQRDAVHAEATLRGRVHEMAGDARRKNGEVFPVLYSVIQLDLEGRPPLYLSATRDVTAEVRAREGLKASAEALRESEARLRTLVDGAAVAIGISHLGRTTWVNDAYLRLFGFDPDTDLRGHPFGARIAESDRRAIEERELRRSRGEPAESTFEATCVRRDGSTFPAHFAMSRLVLPEGPVSVAFITDLSDLKQAQADLALEATITNALRSALAGLPSRGSAEECAAAICEALVEIPVISLAAIFAFGPADELAQMACAGAIGELPAPATSATTRSLRLHELANSGPFAEWWRPFRDDGPWSRALTERDLCAAAYAPIRHQQHADGVLIMGTTDPVFGRTLVERMPRIVDFSSMPSAVLAERVHAGREDALARREIGRVIAEQGFVPHFQPIVRLGTEEVVGYEALTRFGSGQRPDHAFEAAWRVGLGVELELATLDAALAAGDRLPAAWLDLNVSPALMLHARSRLAALLQRAGRQLVLEITEHDAIEDYAAVRDSVRALGGDLWLGVDDAGAGIANFGHIVELHPELVKIDIGLVRGVDTDPGRQALTVAMVHFAAEAGCHLVAEGIESVREAETLQALGVEYGQGYLYGRPQPLPPPDATAPVPARARRRARTGR